MPLALAIGCAHQTAQVKETAAAPSHANVAKDPQVAATSTDTSTDKSDCGMIRVHFELDSSQVQEADKPLLERAAVCLKQDKKLGVTIEGNADERGTEEYNLALGDKRAQAVARYLEALGTSGQQLKTVSYGKEQPECTEHDESCWSKNRRAAVKPTSFTK
jgi:peptidoglycan-associated lipoprotein